MKCSTGLTSRQINLLCADIRDAIEGETWPPSLGLRTSVVITLAYHRQNRVQHDLAEQYATSQSTVSRAIAAISPLLEIVLADHVPAVEDLYPTISYVVDGTLAPCWSWAGEPNLYSGKHHMTGGNLQVACTLTGRLAWVSPPLPGTTHDLAALRCPGLLDHLLPTTRWPTKAIPAPT